jgi:hypothetical protein
MENNGIVRRRTSSSFSSSAAHVARMLEMCSKTYTDWMDRASVQEELGGDGSGWKRMAEEKGVEIVRLRDEAERDGIEVPADLPAVGTIPTRFKLREEVSRLQAQLLAAEAAVEDARTLRLGATHRRVKAEDELHRWKVIAAAAMVLAIISWI